MRSSRRVVRERERLFPHAGCEGERPKRGEDIKLRWTDRRGRSDFRDRVQCAEPQEVELRKRNKLGGEDGRKERQQRAWGSRETGHWVERGREREREIEERASREGFAQTETKAGLACLITRCTGCGCSVSELL